MQNRGKKVSIRGSLEAKLGFSAYIKVKIGFFRVSGPTQFFSGPESVEIVFTDPDLGLVCAKSGQKSRYLRLLIAKIGFLGFSKGDFRVFSGIWPDPIFSGPESVEIGFTDLDLGLVCAKSGQKSKYPRLLIGKIGF